MTNISICDQYRGWGNRMVDGHRVAVRYRDENGTRQVDYYDQYPCFYLNPATFRLLPNGRGRDFKDAKEVIRFFQEDDETHAIFPEGATEDKAPLYKVQVYSRSRVRYFLNNYEPVYGADLDQQDAVVIDNNLTLPEYDLHIGYFDIEALQFKQDDPEKQKWLENVEKPIWHDNQMVNSIVVYSNFTKEYTAFACHPNWEKETIKHEWGTEYRFPREYDLLTWFADWLFSMDFDVITGWNSAGYDLSVLYHRMTSLSVPHPMNHMAGRTENGLFPREVYGGSAMSPYGLMDSPFHRGGREYKWQQQPLRGIDHLDMMVAFERLYKDSTNNELPGRSLGVVGEALFGRGKNPSPDFYSKDYDQSWDEFLPYNIRDVELLVEIDETYNVINSFKSMQTFTGCQFKSTFYATYLARTMFERRAWWKSRTPRYSEEDEEDDDEDDLKGAIVLNPAKEPELREPDDDDVYTDSVGVHDWTVILDFAGLYPSMMISQNTCPSTKVRPGMEHFDDDIIGYNNVRFRREPMGVLPSIVADLDKKRDEYKALLKEAEAANDKKAALKWNTMQLNVKRLRASFYGIMAFDKFSWYDRDVAATITSGGRNSLLYIKGLAEQEGYKVVFGHTDSIFVAMPSEWTREEVLAESERLCQYLTDSIQEKMKSDAVIVDLEVIMDRFFIAKKNRYAGRKVWDDKKQFKVADIDIDTHPTQRIKVSGMEMKQTNTAKVGKTVQIDTLKALFDGVGERVIQRNIKRLVRRIVNGEYPIKELSGLVKVGKHLPHHLDWRGLPIECSCGDCPKPKTGDESKDDDACYVDNYWSSTISLWYNEHLCENDTERVQKGDKVRWVFVKDGPTPIPSNGIIAFREPEEIKDYTLDYEAIAERHVKNIMNATYGALGWDIRSLDPHFKHYRLDAYVGTSHQS